MKKISALALGIVTSIGGYLDVGTIATSTEAGASFGFLLLWAMLVGTICLIVLTNITGRLAAVSQHTLMDGIRERFGARFAFIPLFAELAIDFLVLSAEIGGTCLALQLITGIRFNYWALPVAFIVWLLLWLGTFDVIQNGVALIGLVTLCFVVAVFFLHPPVDKMAQGLVPSLPRSDTAHYLFVAVSMIGATVTPYLFYFYSSGVLEDKWTVKDLGNNRLTAVVGMGFGALLSTAILVVAAMTLFPKGIQMDQYEQAALMLVQPFGYIGFILFVISLGISCFSSALEVGLNASYITAQGFGWNWGESVRPKKAARFALVYTVFIFLSSLLMLIGIDPLQLTLLTFALAVVALPFAIIPLLLLTNDPHYVGEHRSSKWTNTIVILIILLAFVLAIVVIPLEILSGG